MSLICLGISLISIGFGAKLKKKFLFISLILFNFFSKYDRSPSVLFTLKVSGGFIRRYKNYKQITLIKIIILFLSIELKNPFFHVLWSVLSDNLISHRFITKIRLFLIQFARKTVFSFSRKIPKKIIIIIIKNQSKPLSYYQ